jgi:hypothetical protein
MATEEQYRPISPSAARVTFSFRLNLQQREFGRQPADTAPASQAI